MIKGLSEVRRMPRLGKIRLGIKKKKSAKDSRCQHADDAMCWFCSYPIETDYFVVPPEVAAVYGPKPTELDVYLPTDQVEKIFPQRLAWYGAGKLRCTGDGENAIRLFKYVPAAEKSRYPDVEDEFELVDYPCPCPLLESDDCTRNATLNVLLPKVSLGGVYQITSGSVHSIISLNSGIDYVAALFSGLPGGAAMVPLKLKRVKRQIQYRDRLATHAILEIHFEGNTEQRNLLMESQKMVVFQLPAPEKPRPDDMPEDRPQKQKEVNDATAENFEKAKPEEKPKPIVETIMEEMAGKDQAGRDEVFKEHLEVINKMTNENKLRVQAAREGKEMMKPTAMELSPKGEYVQKQIAELKSVKDAKEFNRNRKNLLGLAVNEVLYLSSLLEQKQKELAAAEQSGQQSLV